MYKVLLSLLISATIVSGFWFTDHKAKVREEKRIAEAELAFTELQKQIDALSSQDTNLGADNVTPAGLQTYYLNGGGISSSATSITLTSFTVPQSGYEIQDSNLSATFYITIEPGSRTKQEFVSCTTVSQSSSDTTATLSGCTRGLAPFPDYAASTTLQFVHSGGSRVIFADAPQLYNQFAAKDNDETITGTWTYTSTAQPVYNAAPTFSNSLALITKGYADALVAAGVATSSESQFGGVWLGTALQSASSTNGGTNQPYVMQTRYATDTPQSGCATGYTSTAGAGCVPVAQLNGKLRQSWYDLTEFFSFTSARIASTTLNNPLNLGGLSSSFPTARGSIASVLRDNGSGAWYWGATPRYTVSSATQLQAAADAYATSSPVVIPAGTLTASSTIEFRGHGSCVSVSGTVNCTTHIRLASGATIATLVVGNPTNGVTHSFHWSGQILNNGSVSSQNYIFDKVSMVAGGTNDTVGFSNGTASTNYANEQTLYIVIGGDANATQNLEAYSIVVNP